MRSRRRAARSLAFQVLFELESRPERSLGESLAGRLSDWEEELGEPLDSRSVEFAASLVEGTLEHRDEIDARIQRAAPAFPVNQLPVTDRVSLELGLFELVHGGSTSVPIAINEAVELAKTYGGDNSGKFVNGVLGTIAGELSREETEQPTDSTATTT